MSTQFKLNISDITLAEFDLGGVLYHANYFYLYERTREAFLTASGVPYSSLVSKGYHLAVVESHQKFIAPIYYGQTITINLHTSDITRATVTFNYQIYFADKIIHRAWTRHAMVANNKNFKVAIFPENLKQALISIHG